MTKHPHIWEGEGHPTKGGIRCKLCHAAWSRAEANGECAARAAEAIAPGHIWETRPDGTRTLRKLDG